MTSCGGCGAEISSNDRVCPYCGRSIIRRIEAQKDTQDKAYEIRRDGDNLRVHFGDGISGRRPHSGKDSVSSQYRHGGGSEGSLSKLIVEKLDRLDRQIERGPDLSRQQGSKDMGVALIEYMATMADLLSLYQNAVAREAYLDASDRERLSMKEEKIGPKLRTIMTFCDKVNSETRKRMGLSGSDIRKIKKTAAKTLRMTQYRMCSRCGAMSKPGSKRCRKCKASL